MFLCTSPFQVFLVKKQTDTYTKPFVEEHPFNEKLEITTNGTFFNGTQRNN